MDSFVFVFGPLLPVLTESSAQIVQLEEVGELQRNRIYTAQIIAVNINGERMFDEIAFSKLVTMHACTNLLWLQRNA